MLNVSSLHKEVISTISNQDPKYKGVGRLLNIALSALSGDKSGIDGTMLTLCQFKNGVRVHDTTGIYVQLSGTVDKYSVEIGQLKCTEIGNSLRIF